MQRDVAFIARWIVLVMLVPAAFFCVVVFILEVVSTAGDPPMAFARDGAFTLLRVFDKHGVAAIECQGVEQLKDKGYLEARSLLDDNEYYHAGDWSWSGTMSSDGHFQGTITANGQKRTHGRTYVFTTGNDREDWDIELVTQPSR